MAIVAERYVRALLTSSKNKEESVMFEKGLQDIANLFSSNEEFKNLLLNPCISKEEKIDTLKALFPEACENNIFINFLRELLEEKRINIIENIADEYTKISNDLNKEINIKIIVAGTIDEEQVKDIVNKYKKLYNANTVNYTVELDENVIGGVKVVVGNKIYDNTIKTQLEQIF